MIKLVSWQHDIFVEIERTKTVEEVLHVISSSVHVPPGRITLSSKGVQLQTAKSFAMQGVKPNAKIFIKIHDNTQVCRLHVLKNVLKCEQCGQSACSTVGCVRLHVHDDKLVGLIVDSSQTYIIFRQIISLKLDVLSKITQQLSQSYISRRTIKALKQQSQLKRQLISVQLMKDKIQLDQPRLSQNMRNFSVLNRYFDRNIKINSSSLIGSCFKMHSNLFLVSLFKHLFKIQNLLFEQIKLRSQVEKGLKKAVIMLSKYKHQLHQRVSASIENLGAQGQEYLTQYNKKKKQFQLDFRIFESRREGNDFFVRVRQDKTQVVLNKLNQTITRWKPLGNYVKASINPQSTDRSQITISAEGASDQSIGQYLQTSNLRKQLESTLAQLKLGCQFAQQFNRYLDTQSYRKSIQYLNDLAQIQTVKLSHQKIQPVIDVVLVVHSSLAASLELQKNIRQVQQWAVGQYGQQSLNIGLVLFSNHSKSQASRIIKPLQSSQFQSKISTTVEHTEGNQAVLDGLGQALNLNWRAQAYRLVILVTQLPPYGIQFKNDRFPEVDNFPQGCPCGRTVSQISEKYNEEKAKLLLLSLKKNLSATRAVFSSQFREFQYRKLSSPSQLKLQVQQTIDKTTRIIKQNQIPKTLRLRKTLAFLLNSLTLQARYYYDYLIQIQHVIQLQNLALEIEGGRKDSAVEQTQLKNIQQLEQQFAKLIARKKAARRIVPSL